MHLTPELERLYSSEQLSAREAQRMAHWISCGPIVFEASRVMLKWGILQLLRDNPDGLTIDEVAQRTDKSHYAIQVLLEASLCIGTVLLDTRSSRFALSKTGWFLITDRPVNVDMDFNHDVNYEGWFRLEEALESGKPAGLAHFGDWPTVYEGLSQLPEQVQKSWFGFDHFYSDSAFPEALGIVFGKPVRSLLDVGGNTGRWALQCVAHDPDVRVTILDLPAQLEMMRNFTKGKPGADRIEGHGIDLLNPSQPFPTDKHYDVVWMSQFLDCFSEEQVVSILRRAAAAMDGDSRLLIMETLWDRQRYDAAAFCLTMTSLYFTAIANGNSKMFHSEDLYRLVDEAGLKVQQTIDNIGHGHSIVVVTKGK